jgi:hypothetical protein
MLTFKFFLTFLWRLVAPIVVPAFLLFAKKTAIATTHYAQPQVQRYLLPKFLQWAETPDEHLPGGLYEPTVLKIYQRFGWFVCSWYWLALRNVGSGIVWNDGKEVPAKIRDMSAEDQAKFGVHEKRTLLWRLAILTGWEVTRDWHSTKTDQGFWATPRFTVRLLK